ncbi:uncharacterized protein LOC136073870 [Hydra vulgaris]|uniref:uncharacterized protein LOC136073870 n=1 Tax=Hydra vulgaris TaxID=6087 RepID=UPI0032E9DFD5
MPWRAEINCCRFEKNEPRQGETNCIQNEKNQFRREFNKRKVACAPFSLYPPLLTDFMTRNHVNHAVNQKNFKHIKSYNSFLSFAFFTAEIAPSSNNCPSCFRVCGQILHRVGNIRPKESVQLYICNTNAAALIRIKQLGNDGYIHELMQLLKTLINQEKPFALAFKNMKEVEDEEISRAVSEGRPTFSIRMSLLEGYDRHRYNFSSHEKVPIVIVTENGAHLHPGKYPIFYGKKLFQLYVIDAYDKIERQRLAFIRNNQNKLRNEQYDAFHEHVINRAIDLNVRPGRVVILLSLYVSSPRELKENSDDAMEVIKKYGKPDLFTTFISNPKWREILEKLNLANATNDRPGLVCRVFQMKLISFLEDILKHGVLGKVINHVQIIEFQKSGLPYILLHFVNADKQETTQDINRLISADSCPGC